MENKIYKVTNRSGSTVVYSIPEDNINKEFAPGESKSVSYAELEKLSNRPGGMELINNYLLINDIEAVSKLDIPAEPEYFYGEEEIKKLLISGSTDELLDALDFAPNGVIELIKAFAVSLPLNDVAKRDAILKKTGFNVTQAIQHNAEVKEASNENAAAPKRRATAASVKEETAAPARRSTPEYKIINTSE